jgi:antitoxin YefM
MYCNLVHLLKNKVMTMIQLSVNKFRANIKSFVEQAINNHIPIRVRRRAGRDFIVLSAEDWERDQETLYVLQNASLMKQIRKSIESHKNQSGYKPSEDELNEINRI